MFSARFRSRMRSVSCGGLIDGIRKKNGACLCIFQRNARVLRRSRAEEDSLCPPRLLIVVTPVDDVISFRLIIGHNERNVLLQEGSLQVTSKPIHWGDVNRCILFDGGGRTCRKGGDSYKEQSKYQSFQAKGLG